MPKELSTRKTLLSKKTWQAHFKVWRQSGLSGKEYCRQYHLSYHAFVYWKKKLNKLPIKTVEFVPVSSLIQAAEPGSVLKVEVGGRFKVEISESFTPDILGRVIEVLEACK